MRQIRSGEQLKNRHRRMDATKKKRCRARINDLRSYTCHVARVPQVLDHLRQARQGTNDQQGARDEIERQRSPRKQRYHRTKKPAQRQGSQGGENSRTAWSSSRSKQESSPKVLLVESLGYHEPSSSNPNPPSIPYDASSSFSKSADEPPARKAKHEKRGHGTEDRKRLDSECMVRSPLANTALW